MSSQVAAGDVRARSLDECETYWNAQEVLNAAQERWRKYERELRTNLAAKGLLPNPSVLAKIRSGEAESAKGGRASGTSGSTRRTWRACGARATRSTPSIG